MSTRLPLASPPEFLLSLASAAVTVASWAIAIKLLAHFITRQPIKTCIGIPL